MTLAVLATALSMSLEASWTQIFPADDSNAGCALGTPFSFFVEKDDPGTEIQEVDPSKLLIFFDGGGACWDPKTCVGSLLAFQTDPNLRPTYTPFVDETEAALNALSADPNGAAGILSDRGDNPLAGYTKVYIPYCTGDIHLGSGETTYTYEGTALPISHRGADNVQSVLDWVYDYYSVDVGEAPNKVVFSGSSAGGYAAVFHFPTIAAMLPGSTETFVISDSANAIVTDGFLDLAFGYSSHQGNWKARGAIDPIYEGALAGDAADLPFGLLDALTSTYPGTRVGQTTSAFDAIQSLVLNVMQGVDDDTYDPFTPPTELDVLTTALFDWSPAARINMNLMAWTSPWNYRFLLEAGIGHVQLLTPGGFDSSNFFTEDSAGGVTIRDWVDDMLNRPSVWWRTDWRNLRCTPFCLEPVLTP